MREVKISDDYMEGIEISAKGIEPRVIKRTCQCGTPVAHWIIRSHIPVWEGECPTCGRGRLCGVPVLVQMVADYQETFQNRQFQKR